jgi:hypothetical protein
MRQLLASLGLAPYGGNYESVRQRLAELGIECSHLRTYRRAKGIVACADEEVIQAVRTSRSLAQVLAKLGVRPAGNQSRLKARIKRLGLDTTHFSGMGWRRGNTTPVVPARPLGELLVAGRLVQTNRLKKRLIEEGLKEPMCEICHRKKWNGSRIPLELDHVNGRRNDNRLGNLRLLCPNCHAQTNTYRGRNIGIA